MRARRHAALASIAATALFVLGCKDFDPPPPAPASNLPSFGDAGTRADGGDDRDAGTDDDASVGGGR